MRGRKKDSHGWEAFQDERRQGEEESGRPHETGRVQRTSEEAQGLAVLTWQAAELIRAKDCFAESVKRRKDHLANQVAAPADMKGWAWWPWEKLSRNEVKQRQAETADPRKVVCWDWVWHFRHISVQEQVPWQSFRSREDLKVDREGEGGREVEIPWKMQELCQVCEGDALPWGLREEETWDGSYEESYQP